MRRLARVKHVDPIICRDRPVIMLTGTIDTRERFLMKQAFQSVLARNSLQSLHYNLVVVYRNISLRIDRSQLVLCRSNLIVLGFRRNSDFPQLLVDILHKRRNSLTDCSEIVIIKLLSFRRHSSEQCTSCVDQVFSLLELLSIYKEIFLLRSYGRSYFLRCCISEQSQQTQRLFVDCFHRAKKRCLLIQRFSCVGAECCRNAQCRSCCILSHECRRCTIPCGIPSCLKCGS